MLKAENQNKQIIIKKIDENTINIRIFDNKMLMAIVGEFNSNLNEIESLTNTKLFFRGNSITAKGKKDDIVNVSETFKYLVNKFQITNIIDNGDITYSIKNIVDTFSPVKELELIRVTAMTPVPCGALR